jgi:predicted dehydrogenase
MSKQARPIGVGIIGASAERGWALNAHIPAIQALPQFRLAAVSTSRAESAKSASVKFGVPAFDNPKELASHPDVDLVVVTVKVPQHLALVEAAITAGKHVYCEWPLGNGTEEARRMAAAADRAGVQGFVGLQGRFNPGVQELLRLLKEDYVGQILSTSMIGSGAAWSGRTDSANAYLSDVSNGATMLSIPMGHTLDVACLALGELVPDATIMDVRRSRTDVVDAGTSITATSPDQIAVLGHFAAGVTASIHYRGGLCKGTNFLWEINGTRGDLQLIAGSGGIQMVPVELRGGQNGEPLKPLPVSATCRWVPDSLPNGPALNVAQAYVKVADALAGADHAAATFHDAVRRHEMLDAIQRAIPASR